MCHESMMMSDRVDPKMDTVSSAISVPQLQQYSKNFFVFT